MNCYDVLKEEFINYWSDEIDNNFPNYQLISSSAQKCGDRQVYDLWIDVDNNEIVDKSQLKLDLGTTFNDCIEEEGDFDNFELVFDYHTPLTLQHFADKIELELLNATKVSLFGKYELKYDENEIYSFVENFIEKYFPREQLLGMTVQGVIDKMDIEIVEEEKF